MSEIGAQFARFLGVGGGATLLMYLLLVVQVEMLGWPVVTSSGIAYALSAVFNYAANHRWTFASQQPHRVALPAFTLVAGLGLLLNLGLMHLLTQVLVWPYIFAQMLATTVILLWNFLANRHWTFRVPKRY